MIIKLINMGYTYFMILTMVASMRCRLSSSTDAGSEPSPSPPTISLTASGWISFAEMRGILILLNLEVNSSLKEKTSSFSIFFPFEDFFKILNFGVHRLRRCLLNSSTSGMLVCALIASKESPSPFSRKSLNNMRIQH